MSLKLKYIFTAVMAALSQTAWAMEPFVIKDIRVEGLQRTEAGTVFNYLPFEVGDVMSDQKASQAIKSLYNTGFFNDVRVEADSDVLIITVQERSSIASLEFSGNKSIPSDKMKEGLKSVGLYEGQIFDKSELDRAEQEIKRQYLSQGKYSATVKAKVTLLERNRVGINFDINEGVVAKIRDINIVGNKVFSTDDLRAEFLLTTPNWMSWWNKDDQYSKQKLTADIEALKSFYLNHGYLEFNVDSTQVSITPDKQNVYITINVTEGEKYTISGIKLAGDLPLPAKKLRDLVNINVGDVFSRQKITEANKAISDQLGNEGYAFANVNPVPEINKDKHTADFTFFVDPGRIAYVRRINLTGNTRTRDEVLRREMRQLESSIYSGDKIARTKERLDRLGFFTDVNLDTVTVPNSTDQVDVNINVTERPTGSIQFGAGLSSNEGVVLGITVNQPNFLGTGNQVSAQVNTSKVNTVYSLSYTNPYYTEDGISRGFDIYRRDVDTSSLNVGTYTSTSYGAGMRFGMPLNERDFISAGLTVDATNINLTNQSPQQYVNFCGNNTGCSANSLQLSAAWTHDTRDNILFPNKGVLQRLTGEISVPGLDLQYYKVEYKNAWYLDLTKNLTLLLNGELGYADSYGGKTYPFFKSFYMGGVSSVRGYDAGTIGPQAVDPATGSTYAVGGTKRVLGNAELFMPIPFIKDSSQFRLSAFLDAGNVYTQSQPMNFSDLRYSVGLGISWYSPLGPLKLIWAQPINKQLGDRTQTIQFQLGQQF